MQKIGKIENVANKLNMYDVDKKQEKRWEESNEITKEKNWFLYSGKEYDMSRGETRRKC